MYKFIAFTILFFLFSASYTQNLIENGSFEQLSQIPDDADQVKYAKGWNDMTHPWNNAVGGSPDLYNTLGSWRSPRVVTSRFQLHNAPQDGNSFVGMLIDVPVINNLFIREYIQYIFPKPLEANVKYRLSYYYTTGILESSRVDMFAFNCISAHFTKNVIDHLSETQLYIPETTTKQESVLKSMETWAKVEHEFVLNEPAICMSFGNFCLPSQLKRDTIGKWDGNPFYKDIYESYYLFDNFVLEKVSKPIAGKTLYQVCQGQEIELKITGDATNKWYNSKNQLVVQNVEAFVIQADSNTSYTVIGTTDTLHIKVVAKENPQKIIESVIKTCTPLVFEYKKEAYDSVKISPTLENNTFKENGKYTITTWLAGCSRVDTCLFEIEDCQVELEYPNIFTPNMDNKNDVFKPLKIKNIAKASLAIYNRWGKEVFFTEKKDLSWDGDGANAGVYFYICKYEDRFGKENAVNGWVVITE